MSTRAGRRWPKIKRKELHPRFHYGDHIVLVDDFLSAEEADAFVKTAEEIGFQHQGSRGEAYGEAVRDNHRISLIDSALAEALWSSSGLREALKDLHSVYKRNHGAPPKGLNPNIRIYKYERGQKFGKHVDDSVEIQGAVSGHTEYTLLIYLSGGGKGSSDKDSLKGGETKFYDERGRTLVSIEPRTGLALLHRHGDHCLEHEGAQVNSGTKYVLRSDVVF